MLSEEADRRPQLLASRSFAAGNVLYCYVEVYGAAKDRATGAPRVTQGYALLDASGKARLQEAASPLTLGGGGQMARSIAIPLARIAPGEYELVLSFRDEVGGSAKELREPFSVSHPSRPNLGLYADLVRTYLEGDTQHALSRLIQWSPEHLGELATKLVQKEDETWRRAALLMHTELALYLWGHGRGPEAADHIAIGRALLKQVTPSDLHRDWLLLLAYARQSEGFAGLALEPFAECTRLYPNAAEAWLGAGTAHEYTAYPDGFGGTQVPVPPREAAQEAERCYREAVRLDPTLTEARLRLGRVLQRTGRPEEAEQEFSNAVETSRDAYLTALTHLFWGQLQEARGSVTEATQHYRAALDADRACQPAALALSHLLRNSGHAREAAETLASELRATEGGKRSPWLEYHLGLGRRYRPALAALRQGLPAIAEQGLPTVSESAP
jgi:tetratricopeptide (TPR) repeat protein